jgi:HD superfamily phosphohydrolase
VALLSEKPRTQPAKILGSILSGPIDIDKMDYLYRDSLHAGVPYGQNFDSLRLIRSLCLNETGDRLAITNKGRTAAELMVFARYVMFSEVYWHHAVRSATAMFQRAFYLWHLEQSGQPQFETRIKNLFQSSETQMIAKLRSECGDTPAGILLDHLFGDVRKLYKRVANYSVNENEKIYRQIAQQPYSWLMQSSNRLAKMVGKQLGRDVAEHEVLIDAPPVGLEVQFDVDVFYPEANLYRKLGDVSPVVNTLARRQFDDFVKQVRIFVSPRLIADAAELDFDDLVLKAVQD